MMLFKGFRKNIIPDGDEGREIRERLKDESLCRKCGKCCHLGFIVGGIFFFFPQLPCKFLKENGDSTYHCEVYEKRDRIEWCNPCKEETIMEGLFPPDCVYVQGIPNYRGKIELPEDENERNRIKKKILRQVRYMPKPEYIKPTDWARFMRELQEEKTQAGTQR